MNTYPYVKLAIFITKNNDNKMSFFLKLAAIDCENDII